MTMTVSATATAVTISTASASRHAATNGFRSSAEWMGGRRFVLKTAAQGHFFRPPPQLQLEQPFDIELEEDRGG